MKKAGVMKRDVVEIEPAKRETNGAGEIMAQEKPVLVNAALAKWLANQFRALWASS
jgi:hypothetical protein